NRWRRPPHLTRLLRCFRGLLALRGLELHGGREVLVPRELDERVLLEARAVTLEIEAREQGREVRGRRVADQLLDRGRQRRGQRRHLVLLVERDALRVVELPAERVGMEDGV